MPSSGVLRAVLRPTIPRFLDLGLKGRRCLGWRRGNLRLRILGVGFRYQCGVMHRFPGLQLWETKF